MFLLREEMLQEEESKGWKEGDQGCGFETCATHWVFLQGKSNKHYCTNRLFVKTCFRKVQPDMDELTQNAEEPDDGEKPEVQKLGKLQYKVMRFLTALIYNPPRNIPMVVIYARFVSFDSSSSTTLIRTAYR